MIAGVEDPERRRVIVTIGILQILAWGSSYYLLGVLAAPIAADTGWPLAGVVAGLSLALLAAGLVSPFVGRTIQERGGRPVLACSSLLMATGLALLGASPNLPVYLAGWLLIGFGMGSGLYDPAFATLGRHFGREARRMISAITLFGGFASTVSWPLSAWLMGEIGWRGVCVAYAGLHIAIGLPGYLVLLPRRPPTITPDDTPVSVGAAELPAHRQRAALLLFGAILTLGSVTLSLVSMHLLTLLQSRGIELAAAIALGALVGPSQVAARVVELAAGRRFHPLAALLVSVILVALGIALLWGDFALTALALIFYGAGNGISSIVRGTVPLVLFGPARYAVLMGQLGLPILLAMAAAPIMGALLIDSGGADLTLRALAAISVINIALTVQLLRWCRTPAPWTIPAPLDPSSRLPRD